MNKKSTTLTALKRPSTRSLSTNKLHSQPADKYAFQSDDEDHQSKPVLVRKSLTSPRRPRGRPAKKSKDEELPSHRSASSSDPESGSETEDSSSVKRKRSGKYTSGKPVTRRASRLVSQTNTPIGEKASTPKKRGRKGKMSNPTENELEADKSKQTSETENIVPAQSAKRRYTKKKSLSTDTNSKTDLNEDDDPNGKLSTVDEKDLMQFGSPQHQPQSQSQQRQSEDEFSDDSVEFVWKGSSKMSIEILKRRIPKDEPREYSAMQSDPTAQRKRAIIPRLTNFDALSGQPVENSPVTTKRPMNDISEQNPAKKSTSVITLNNVFQNDFVPSYNDTGAKMTTTTASAGSTEDKPRPRIYAVKSTTMKARPQGQQPEIKRPKWMNDQQGKSDEEEDEDNLPPAGEEPDDFDYVPKGQYMPKRPSYRGRGTYPGRRGTGMRGRPPGSRRQYHDDDDDDDYDQYEETNSRYGARRQTAYRTPRNKLISSFLADSSNVSYLGPMYDVSGGDEDDDYDKTRRISLTQAYRRNNTARPPFSAMSNQRRIAINNGNHPIYKVSSPERSFPST